MARTLNRLSARRVASLKEPGRYADGGGLYLRITLQGAKSWVFMTTVAGKRQETGLGPETAVSLATARTFAADMRAAAARGSDPRTALPFKAALPQPTIPTFEKFAEDYIASVEGGWKNHVHRQQWRNSLRDHAKPILQKPVDQIGTGDVLAALEPIWLSTPETANRVRGRIEKILAAAKARGFRPKDAANPAQWRGHLELMLAKQSKLGRGHHGALAWRDARAFMAELRKRPALAARALEFTILTAARSGETLGATWGEIDLRTGLWTLPATRMKAGVEHVVPLSKPAIDLLRKLRPADAESDDLVFSVGGAARSNMAMNMLLRRMGRRDITTHGFRSTFRDWAGDATEFPRELVEQALAHTISNKVERAYRRGTAIERRRVLMEQWSAFLLDQPSTDHEPR